MLVVGVIVDWEAAGLVIEYGRLPSLVQRELGCWFWQRNSSCAFAGSLWHGASTAAVRSLYAALLSFLLQQFRLARLVVSYVTLAGSSACFL